MQTQLFASVILFIALAVGVVLDQNLFKIDRYENHKVRPVAVLLDGELVHGALPQP